MPTARSWTEQWADRLTSRRHVEDLGALLRFRLSGLSARQRRRSVIGALLVVALTGGVIAYAAWLPGQPRDHPGRILALLPSAMLAFLALAALSASASGGGREVVPRAQAVAFPISSTTEHLGAVLMAPLNIAWLVQAWTLLGMAAYALGPQRLWATEIPVALWIGFATVSAQLVGWALEGVRRGRRGVLLVRGLLVVLAGLLAGLVLSHRLVPLLDHSPTRRVLWTMIGGTGRWALGVVALLVLTLLAGYGGALAAHWALARAEREELRLESGRRAIRPMPRSAFVAMVRVNRSAIWRSVPLRRGIGVLALMPGTVALIGALHWDTLTVFPGLVVSGGALLFGVNSWCLDGRGALWRESLPAPPRMMFWARAWVLAEVLVASAVVTALLGGLRAGRPTASEIAALVCTAVVVTVQVVATSLRWSVRRPFASDMRSARATPAPPVVMVGYSARLACWTTFTGIGFSGLAVLPDWRLPIAVAVVMCAWSSYRLLRAAREWDDPVVRARVVTTVAG